jgi:hypothetical protein
MAFVPSSSCGEIAARLAEPPAKREIPYQYVQSRPDVEVSEKTGMPVQDSPLHSPILRIAHILAL